MDTLNKTELTQSMAERLLISKAESHRQLDVIVEQMILALCQNKHLKLADFGQFRIRNQPMRKQTKAKQAEKYQITSYNRVVFICGSTLKESLNK